jgi:hypothetical protein
MLLDNENSQGFFFYQKSSGSTVDDGAVSLLGSLTSTGLNSTAIGATTPSTGAFTTLSASGAFLQDFNGAGGNAVNVRFNSSNQRGGLYVNGSSGGPFVGGNLAFSSGSTFNYDKTAAAWAIGDAPGNNALNFFWVASGTAGTLAIDASTTTQRVGFYNATGWNLSTGLAVTGAVSATGTSLTLGTNSGSGTARRVFDVEAGGYASPGAFNTDSNGDKINLFKGGTALGFDARIGVGNAQNVWYRSSGSTSGAGVHEFYVGSTPTLIQSISSTGLAVTGELSSTGALAIGNTVAAAVAVASTHKVTIVIGGVTYYLLASDV